MDFCIFGAASPETPEKYTEPVRRFAKKMAQRGHDLVFGGGADGVMGASAIGTQQGETQDDRREDRPEGTRHVKDASHLR